RSDSIHSNGEKGRVPEGSVIDEISPRGLLRLILADSCRLRQRKPLAAHRILLVAPHPLRRPAAQDYRARRSTAAAGLTISRLPSARFLSSTLPSPSPRGPTMICQGIPIRSAV